MVEAENKIVINWFDRIVGEGTKNGKVHKGDLVMYNIPDSETSWSTPAKIKGVYADGTFFSLYRYYPLNTTVKIACPGGKGHTKHQ